MRHTLFVVLLLLALGWGVQALPPPEAPLTDLRTGLVAWWVASPGLTKSRTLYNVLAPGRHRCTLTNMSGGLSSQTSGWHVPTRRGSAGELRFDLTDDFVTCGTPSSLDLTGDVTILAWVYLNTFGGGGFGRILDKRGTSSTGYVLHVNDQLTTGSFTMLLNAGSAYGQNWADTAGGTLVAGVWIHVAAIVHSATAITFYINGRLAAQEAGSGALSEAIASSSSVALVLGAASGRTDRNFDGRLDDVMLYRRRLTAQEVRLIYDDSLRAHVGLFAGLQGVVALSTTPAARVRHRSGSY